ncbi:hypothetical protein Taro_025918 [Colocasia esculenta]|uniref:CCHC-type domain-containing protein n=1 Tax=Colocasia esculenta TaxID=4460 RepID=A0A843VFM0_COLES|nr:hypothetical protein [Colocasia esculenta]
MKSGQSRIGQLMASRDRRGGVPTRDGKQRRDVPRREEQTEKQDPAPQGPGLVQAMQTQAHTQAALQAQMEAQEGVTPAAPFQQQDKKKAAYQTPQRPMAASSTQVPSQRSPGVKKECPHCEKTHGGTKCWLVAGKCLMCGSSDHKIKDCLRLQQAV